MESLPLWALNILCLIGLLASIEAGVRIGHYREASGVNGIDQPISAVVGALLALLAFLLAVTVSMATDRYNNRRGIIVQEANAIGTAYLRADFLRAAEREEAQRILREYVAHRAGGMAAITSPEGMAKSSALQDQLWAVTARVGVANDSESVALFIISVNETIDLNAVRLAANRNRIPRNVWAILAVVSCFAMLAVGYEFGLTRRRNWLTIILLVVVFATVITMIADLDSPQWGYIQISQQPLIDLINAIGTPTP